MGHVRMYQATLIGERCIVHDRGLDEPEDSFPATSTRVAEQELRRRGYTMLEDWQDRRAGGVFAVVEK